MTGVFGEDLGGTSSVELFDTMLLAGGTDYLSHASVEERAFLEETRTRLSVRAVEIRDGGFEGKTVSTWPPFVEYRGRPLSSLADSESGDFPENNRRIWSMQLGRVLLVELWDQIVLHDLGDNKEKKFVGAMYDCLYGNDVQFGYKGDRASVVNNALLYSASTDAELRFTARRTVALLEMLREVVRPVAPQDQFWPYHVDSKSFSMAFVKEQ